jgi:hypothetical protein
MREFLHLPISAEGAGQAKMWVTFLQKRLPAKREPWMLPELVTVGNVLTR